MPTQAAGEDDSAGLDIHAGAVREDHGHRILGIMIESEIGTHMVRYARQFRLFVVCEAQHTRGRDCRAFYAYPTVAQIDQQPFGKVASRRPVLTGSALLQSAAVH